MGCKPFTGRQPWLGGKSHKIVRNFSLENDVRTVRKKIPQRSSGSGLV